MDKDKEEEVGARPQADQALVASDGAAARLHPAGVDPSRVVRVVKVFHPTITVEREPLGGAREIWARHAERPEFDVKLVTVHYSYAYLDNSTIGGVAEQIARLLAGSDSDRSGEAGETGTGSTEGKSAGPQGHRPTPSPERTPHV